MQHRANSCTPKTNAVSSSIRPRCEYLSRDVYTTFLRRKFSTRLSTRYTVRRDDPHIITVDSGRLERSCLFFSFSNFKLVLYRAFCYSHSYDGPPKLAVFSVSRDGKKKTLRFSVRTRATLHELRRRTDDDDDDDETHTTARHEIRDAHCLLLSSVVPSAGDSFRRRRRRRRNRERLCYHSILR